MDDVARIFDKIDESNTRLEKKIDGQVGEIRTEIKDQGKALTEIKVSLAEAAGQDLPKRVSELEDDSKEAGLERMKFNTILVAIVASITLAGREVAGFIGSIFTKGP